MGDLANIDYTMIFFVHASDYQNKNHIFLLRRYKYIMSIKQQKK